jgi:hypothetical protein
VSALVGEQPALLADVVSGLNKLSFAAQVAAWTELVRMVAAY